MRSELPALALVIVVGGLACRSPGLEDTDNEDDSGETTPVCGDGKLDPPETCDDGNTQPGDGCSASCLLSGTATQCITLMRGEGGNSDEVTVVLPFIDSFLAAGSLDVDGQNVAWVGKWTDEGEKSWLTTMPSENGTLLRDVTADGSTGYWAALANSGAELAHLDENGDVLERISFPDASLYRVRWIEGRLWAAGWLESESSNFHHDLWLAFLDDGNLETVLLEDHLGFDETIEAMEVHGERVLVIATLGTSPGYDGDVVEEPTSEVVVIVLDLDGNELERVALDVGSLETPRATSVWGAGAHWMVAGYAPPVHALLQRPQIWLTNAEDDWTWNSLSVFGTQQGSQPQGGASVGGIVTVDTGVVLVGGSKTGPGPTGAPVELTGWLMEFDSAGQLVWEYHATEPAESWYAETAVAIGVDGRIRTAGVGWTAGASSTLRSCIMER